MNKIKLVCTFQMQDLIAKYVELSKEDPEQDASWQPLAKDGQTKV